MEIKNPNRDWVVRELETLLDEWRQWQSEVEEIKDHPYNKKTQTEVFADGVENMQKHRVLQAKTQEFLNQNILMHGFIYKDGRGVDRTDLRLKVRVQHRLHDLEEIQARIQYASVADGYWRAQGKKLVGQLVRNPHKAIEIATNALKNSQQF